MNNSIIILWALGSVMHLSLGFTRLGDPSLLVKKNGERKLMYCVF